MSGQVRSRSRPDSRGARAVSHGCTSMARDARATRNGARRTKTPGGVTSSATEPRAAAQPASARVPVKDRRLVPASSRRDVDADPGQQATAATRLQTLACSGGTQTPSKAEYDTSEVTPPAAPTAPATTPAAINTTASPRPGTTVSVTKRGVRAREPVVIRGSGSMISDGKRA